MGQDIYTKVIDLKDEYETNGIQVPSVKLGHLLVHSILNVPKSDTLSHAKTFDSSEIDFNELTENASRTLKARHIKAIRKNIIQYDSSSLYGLDSLPHYILEILPDFENSRPGSLENTIYLLSNVETDSKKGNKYISAPFENIGKKIMQGSKKYSKLASDNGQKGRDWALFKEYNAISKELDKLK